MVETLTIGTLVAVIAFLVWYPASLRRHPQRRHAHNSAQSGLVRGMDEIWHPEAVAPSAARDEETRLVRPAPAPDPDRTTPDGVIRIRLEA